MLARRLRKSVAPADILSHMVLILACLFILVPAVFLLLGSVKSVGDFFGDPFGLPTSPVFSNYSDAWRDGGLGRPLAVSAVATGLSVLFSTIISALVSHSIANLGLFGSRAWRIVFVAGLVVPVQLIMLALFIVMRQMGLLGSVWSLVVTYTTFGIPLGVLILVGFFESVPRGLLDAARIDGASQFALFRGIVLPLSGPALLTVTVLNGVWIWNDVFIALMLSTTSATQTLPLAILNFFGTYSSEWGLIFAGVVISAIPVVIAYALGTRVFMRGLSAGALKE